MNVETEWTEKDARVTRYVIVSIFCSWLLMVLAGVLVGPFGSPPSYLESVLAVIVFGQFLGAKWGNDSWIVPGKWSKFVDAVGDPLVFT